MANLLARLLNQFILKIQTEFSARSDKQGEEEQVLDEFEF